MASRDNVVCDTESVVIAARNDALAEQHRSLMRQCSGANPEAYKLEVDQQLGVNASLATSLTASPVVVWKALHEQSRGKLVATSDSGKGSPGFVDVGLHLTGADPAAGEDLRKARSLGRANRDRCSANTA